MLQAGAKALLETHGGELPRTVEQLLAIPGRCGVWCVCLFFF